MPGRFKALPPILVVAYETGMRKAEILNLRWSAVDLNARRIRLQAEDTKTEEARTSYLTERVLASLRELPRSIADGPVFMNPSTGESFKEIRFMFRRAVKRAGLPRPTCGSTTCAARSSRTRAGRASRSRS